MEKHTELDTVRQVVIAAGGRGKRMGPVMESVPCKSLLEYRGQTMLEWLLDGLHENGFEDYLVAVNPHCVDGVTTVLRDKGIDKPPVTIDLDEGFRRVARTFEDQLAERFLLLNGHHPVPGSHFNKMLATAATSKVVMTSYNNDEHTLDSLHAFVVESGADDGPVEVHETHLTSEDLSKPFTYVRHPYIVTPDAIQRANEDNYRHIFGAYIFSEQESSRMAGVVRAEFRPEFDFPHEFEATKHGIDRRLSK